METLIEVNRDFCGQLNDYELVDTHCYVVQYSVQFAKVSTNRDLDLKLLLTAIQLSDIYTQLQPH